MKTPSLRFISSPPKDVSVRVHHDANQSVANTTNTVLAFNQERWDTHAQHDPSTNNSRLTCKIAGKYLIIGNFWYESNATGERDAWIRLNGTTKIGETRQEALELTPAGTYVIVTTIYELAVDDYVELGAWQNSGGALNVDVAANTSPEFMMAKLRG